MDIMGQLAGEIASAIQPIGEDVAQRSRNINKSTRESSKRNYWKTSNLATLFILFSIQTVMYVN